MIVFLCIIALVSAACTEPPDKYYRIKFESDFVDSVMPLSGNDTYTGSQTEGIFVYDTTTKRVFSSYNLFLYQAGSYKVQR